MEIKTSKTELVKALTPATNAVGSKNVVAILNNVLIQANKEKECVIITGTDLEIGIRTTCNAQVVSEGVVTAPAKKLYDIVRELPDGEVEIAVGKNNAVNIRAGKAFFKVLGLEADDFPKFPELDKNQFFEIDQKTLKHCLSATVFSVSRDEARYTLNGVLMAVRNGAARFVATDGKRLAFVQKEVNLPKEVILETIIPTKAVFELTKTLSETGIVRVAYSQNQILFEFDGTAIISRLIEGKFPNYEQVIPKEQKTSTQIHRETFLSAVRRMAILTSQENQSVKLDFTKGKVLVSSRSPSLGEAKEELEADVTGEDLAIGFNPGYLTDILKNIDTEQVSLSMGGPDKPGLFKKDDGYLYVVMPMQLTY